MKEKEEEIKNPTNSENMNEPSDSTISSSSSFDNKAPAFIINPELQTMKSIRQDSTKAFI